MSSVHFMVRALAHRNYRLFFSGQIVSLVGTWLSMVASSWLVYKLAGREGYDVPWVLGVVSFCAQFPVFLITPLAGVGVDRWNRQRVLLCTQALAMLQSFALAALTLTDRITIGQLLALSVVQGLINALDVPARQAFVVDVVDDRDDLSNAIALNSSMVHGARLFGPALGGYLIYAVGEGYCFLIDGFSYLAVLVALAAIRVAPRVKSARNARAWTSFVEGLRYAHGFQPIRVLLLMVAVTSLAAISQSTLMPIIAGDVLGGDELTLGCLLGSSGLGALAGSLYLAARRSVLGLGRVIAVAGVVLGSTLLLFSLSRVLIVSMGLMTVGGCALVVQMASCNTVLQTIVDDDKRGRVMALFSMAFLGVAPLGSLLAGGIASRTSAPVSLALSGVIALLASAAFAWQLPRIRPLIRPIYEAKGILPSIALGIESTETIATPSTE